MKVKVESFGGIVGHRQGERSSPDLSAEQLAALEALKSATPGPVVPGPRPHYRVTVTDEHGVRQFDMAEQDMPDALMTIPDTAP